jgi:hypothetical protein
MKYPVGTKLMVSDRATSLYLQELAEGRCGIVYTVIYAFNDGMNIDRVTLKADDDHDPKFVGVDSDLFETIT